MKTANSSRRSRSEAAAGLLVLLTAIWFTGCDASPYDLAERRSAVVSSDVRQAVDKLITEANAIAVKQDGEVYLDVQEFERVIIFVPAPAPYTQNPGRTVHSARSVAVPENGIVKTWTDNFALAQELSYRYSFVEITQIEQHFSPPYFTAKFKVQIKASHRCVYAGKPKDIPAAPIGYIVWNPHNCFIGGFAGPGGGWYGLLSPPKIPPGKVVESSMAIDGLAQSALNHLSTISHRKSEHVITLRLEYNHHKKRWYVATNLLKSPSPKYLPWSYGVDKDYTYTILKPSQIHPAKPNSKSAPKK
ncbi:MAG: hypothetical protein HN350_06865 [Phycisphaerales bacterium]|jgi:hypothetical protein|nr:hypothetical protein [Phycisphaerales bacterium]